MRYNIIKLIISTKHTFWHSKLFLIKSEDAVNDGEVNANVPHKHDKSGLNYCTKLKMMYSLKSHQSDWLKLIVLIYSTDDCLRTDQWQLEVGLIYLYITFVSQLVATNYVLKMHQNSLLWTTRRWPNSVWSMKMFPSKFFCGLTITMYVLILMKRTLFYY